MLAFLWRGDDSGDHAVAGPAAPTPPVLEEPLPPPAPAAPLVFAHVPLELPARARRGRQPGTVLSEQTRHRIAYSRQASISRKRKADVAELGRTVMGDAAQNLVDRMLGPGGHRVHHEQFSTKRCCLNGISVPRYTRQDQSYKRGLWRTLVSHVRAAFRGLCTFFLGASLSVICSTIDDANMWVARPPGYVERRTRWLAKKRGGRKGNMSTSQF